MLVFPGYYWANKLGIPRVQSTKVTVETDDVEFYFDGNRLFSDTYSGLVLVKVEQTIPTDTTTTLPIVFNSTNGKQNVTTFNGANVTVAGWSGTGIYLMYYDRVTNTLQRIS